MGLGKTISMIALILSNPRECDEKGAVQRSSQVGELDSVVSKASLVICPSHLISQWMKEITSNTSLKCFAVPTIVQHRRLSYKIIAEADVVIVSPSYLFINSSYQLLLKRKESALASKMNHSCPLFHRIDWNRIILDEGHESVSQFVETRFTANHRWYVTGTPFPCGGPDFLNALRFLGFKLQHEKRSWLAQMIYCQEVKRQLYRRNTKDEVAHQIDIPAIQEKLILVTLSPVERAIYESSVLSQQPEFLRNFISDPVGAVRLRRLALSDPKLLESLRSEHQNSLLQEQGCLKNALSKIEDLGQQLLRRDMKATIRSDFTDQLERLKTQILHLEDLILKTITMIACFSDKFVPEAPLDEICEAGCGQNAKGCFRFQCGHRLCAECLPQIIEVSERSCQSCHTKLDFTQLDLPAMGNFAIAEEEEEASPGQEWCACLRETYGSKFAATAGHNEVQRC